MKADPLTDEKEEPVVYKREKSASPPAAPAKEQSEEKAEINGPKEISVHEMDLSSHKNEDTFVRSKTGDLDLTAQIGDLNMTALDGNPKNDDSKMLDDSYLCELPFVKMSSLRRGSMEHVKGRVGSFWGQSAISKKSRMTINDSMDEINMSHAKEDDSFMDL